MEKRAINYAMGRERAEESVWVALAYGLSGFVNLGAIGVAMLLGLTVGDAYGPMVGVVVGLPSVVVQLIGGVAPVVFAVGRHAPGERLGRSERIYLWIAVVATVGLWAGTALAVAVQRMRGSGC